MTQDNSRSGLTYPARAVIGLVLAVGGLWFSKNVKIPFLEDLAQRGIALDFGKTIAVIGVLIILFPIIEMFFTGPLEQAIRDRDTELEKTFAEVEELRNEMARMKSDYEQRLAATEQAAREQIQAQIREAQQLRAQLMAEASERAEQLVRQAREEIERERERVIHQLRIDMVGVTLKATEHILGENIDDERNRRLVREFIEKAEVPV